MLVLVLVLGSGYGLVLVLRFGFGYTNHAHYGLLALEVGLVSEIWTSSPYSLFHMRELEYVRAMSGLQLGAR